MISIIFRQTLNTDNHKNVIVYFLFAFGISNLIFINCIYITHIYIMIVLVFLRQTTCVGKNGKFVLKITNL